MCPANDFLVLPAFQLGARAGIRSLATESAAERLIRTSCLSAEHQDNHKSAKFPGSLAVFPAECLIVTCQTFAYRSVKGSTRSLCTDSGVYCFFCIVSLLVGVDFTLTVVPCCIYLFVLVKFNTEAKLIMRSAC